MAQDMDRAGQWLDQMWQKLCGLIASLAGRSQELVYSSMCQWGENFMNMIREKLPEAAAGLAVGAAKGIGTFFIIFVVAIVGAILLMKNKERISRQLSENLFAPGDYIPYIPDLPDQRRIFKCQIIIITVSLP